MKVIEFVKENGFEKLTEMFGVSVKEYTVGEDILVVLNYNQIESPKNDITNECRSLILNKNTLEVVSRSFDRFFNYGEQPDTQKDLDLSKAYVFDKIDGSLIKIYNFKGKWHISTRGTAFADSDVNGFGITFRDLVLKALNIDTSNQLEADSALQNYCDADLDPKFTYIFEVTSAENRVVTQYNGYTLWFLACRNNNTGNYEDEPRWLFLNVHKPALNYFNSVDACIKSAKELPNLKEGYVVYQDGVPICKIKNPAYLCVHNIRGEGLTPKRIADLVLMNEQDEYLTYFPEDQVFFDPYVSSFCSFRDNLERVYEENKQIEDQKEFALKVKDVVGSSAMFIARKKHVTVLQAFNDQSDTFKRETLFKFMKERECA